MLLRIRATLLCFVSGAFALALVQCASPASNAHPENVHAEITSGAEKPKDEAPKAEVETKTAKTEIAAAPREKRVKEPKPIQSKERPAVPEIDDAMVEAMLDIIRKAPNRQANVFAKFGGSSIASKAFLHCFRGKNVDLGEHTDLQESLDFFKSGRAARKSPFSRVSLAAEVGWSIRHGLAQKPPRMLQEVRAISPRYALLFFGGNDVQGKNPRVFAGRLIKSIDLLIARGVIPILGSVMPRGDKEEMDAIAKSFNELSAAVADAYRLPYIDFDQVARKLPNNGLAGDGVHPNVLMVGARGQACVFTEEGLKHGQNMRNLLVMKTLARLHEKLDSDAVVKRLADEQNPMAITPVNNTANPPKLHWVETLPGATTIDHEDWQEENGHYQKYVSFNLPEARTLRVTILDYEHHARAEFGESIKVLNASDADAEKKTFLIEVPAGVQRFKIVRDKKSRYSTAVYVSES